ncbi:MAG: hypothetical protein ACPGVH_05150 [Chitinophagales bacterium]
MQKIIQILRNYKKVEKHIYQLIIANFFLQLINGSFFVLANYYFTKNGYLDFEIAAFIEKRFLAVMLIAFPLGLLIKGRKLKPFFFISAICSPTASLLLLYAVETQNLVLIKISLFLAGAFFVFMQATVMPFILLNAKKEVHSESIALHFQTWVSGTIVVGSFYYLVNKFGIPLSERDAILFFTLLGYVSIFFLTRINIEENISEKFPINKILVSYDWNLIIKAVLPTLFIAIGAGFTIPFINLFFENIHGISSDTFSITASLTFILVFLGMGIMPSIKAKFGYKISITLVQSLSILCLVIMASTEWYAHLPAAAAIAIFFYVLRQPLMNIAGPMTSELTMYYVGKKNQELISALSASIWSGSWFFSSRIFAVLRKQDLPYVNIFMITAFMYILGVIWYNYLINAYYKKEKLESLENLDI